MANKQQNNPIKTVLVISVGFLGIYLLTEAQWAAYISFGVGIAGVFSNWLAQKIEWVWMKIAWLLSKIVPNILMAVIYYFLLTPIALLKRAISSKNMLNLRRQADTNFLTRDKTFSKKDLENPW